MSDQYPSVAGYRNPPAHGWFKKGKSGNQRGRPRKREDLFVILHRVLKRKVRIKDGDHQLPIREALIRKLREMALAGDRRALAMQRQILEQAPAFQPQPPPPIDVRATAIAVAKGLNLPVPDWLDEEFPEEDSD